MEVINPYTQETIGTIKLSDKAEVERIVQSAVTAKESARQMTSGERSEVLRDIVKKIEEHFETFVLTIASESGKPYRYAKGEVERAIQTFTIAAEEAKRLPHELIDLDSTEKGRGLRGEVVYQPRGVVFGV